MKNKSKLSKIKQPKGNKSNVPAEWFYMTTKLITVRDVKSAVQEQAVEIWDEAGILELEFEDAKSFIFENTKVDLCDEYSNAFLEEYKIKTLFLVTIDPEYYEIAKQVMDQIIKSIGGFFCADTENFLPRIG